MLLIAWYVNFYVKKKLLNSKDIDIFHEGLDLYFYEKHFSLAYFNLQT